MNRIIPDRYNILGFILLNNHKTFLKLPQVEDFSLWRQTRRAYAVPERAELCFADVCAERLPLARSTVCQKTFMSDKEEEDEAKMEETHRKE